MADRTNSGSGSGGRGKSAWPSHAHLDRAQQEYDQKHADSLDDSMGAGDVSFDTSMGGGAAGATSSAAAAAAGEVLAANTGGSAEDDRFDRIVGALQEVIMDPAFQDRQNTFCRAHCHKFDATDENKLCYTPLFAEYTELIETYVARRLAAAVPGFSMDAFVAMLATRQDEICGDAFDVLLSCGDFAEFKDLMLAHKAQAQGTVGFAAAGGGAGGGGGGGASGMMMGGGGGGGGGGGFGVGGVGMGLSVQAVTNNAALAGGGGDPNGADAMDFDDSFASSPDRGRFSHK